MKKDLDFEKIRNILEKIENQEPLDKDEKVYLDIIKALKEKKNCKVEINEDFKNSLKNQLLVRFDKLYKRKSFYQKFSYIMQIPFFRFAVSFCFVFSLTLGIYSNINFKNLSGINTTNEMKSDFGSDGGSQKINSMPNSDFGTVPDTLSEKQEKSAESPIPSSSLQSNDSSEIKDSQVQNMDLAQPGARSVGGIHFQSSDNFSTDKGVAGGVENFSPKVWIKDNLHIFGILLFSIVISLFIALRKNKK